MSGIPDLVEAIKLQATGPAEAARAIRKKLKYGNIHRQLRALTLLDGLIQNAGSRFQRTFADEMLLERLRVCGTADLSDPLVRDKCKVLFRQWAVEYKNVRGLEQIAALYKVSRINSLATEYHLQYRRNYLVGSKSSRKISQKFSAKQNRILLRMMKKRFRAQPQLQLHRIPDQLLSLQLRARRQEAQRLLRSSPALLSPKKTRKRRKERRSTWKKRRKR